MTRLDNAMVYSISPSHWRLVTRAPITKLIVKA